jgi:hypothetical protein
LWTPVLTFATPGDLNVVYSTQVGTYLRVGSLILATFNIATSTFTHGTASGDCNITGLPFASKNVTGDIHYGVLAWAGITKANYTQINASLAPNLSLMTLQAYGSAQAAATIAVADMPTGGAVRLRGTIIYEAA